MAFDRLKKCVGDVRRKENVFLHAIVYTIYIYTNKMQHVELSSLYHSIELSNSYHSTVLVHSNEQQD